MLGADLSSTFQIIVSFSRSFNAITVYISLYEKRLCIRVDLNFFINYERLMKRIFRRNFKTKLLWANATLKGRTSLPLFFMKERIA